MKSIIRCQDCGLWEMNPQDMSQGFCRAEPPRAFPMQSREGIGTITLYPVTQRHEGCGKGVVESKLIS